MFLGEKLYLTVCVRAYVVHGYVLTFRASSGTVSSPLTTVNRLVCETDRLRKDWLQLWYLIWYNYDVQIHTHFIHTRMNSYTTSSCKLYYLHIAYSKEIWQFGKNSNNNICAWKCFWKEGSNWWWMGRFQKIRKVKGYHIQISACPPTSESCTSAPGCGHHLQRSAEGRKYNN